MDKLLAASPNPSRAVLNAADVDADLRPGCQPAHLVRHRQDSSTWRRRSPINSSKLDPADAATFTANAKTFNDSLARSTRRSPTSRPSTPGAPVGYTERVPGYLVEAAGLKLATPASFAQSIEDGNDPSPADNAAMDAALTDKTIKVLLYNGQVTEPGDRRGQAARAAERGAGRRGDRDAAADRQGLPGLAAAPDQRDHHRARRVIVADRAAGRATNGGAARGRSGLRRAASCGRTSTSPWRRASSSRCWVPTAAARPRW